MTEPITETLVLEVTGVDKKTWYPRGYSEPSETLTMIKLSSGDQDSIRRAEIAIPGDLPLGTRFKVTIKQADEVTAATIHRGALPIIDESRQLKGTGGDIQ